ncbi:MAG: hypothetical protein IJV01_03300 [Bacteroidales bacterium]|nr:hypothetical protein [Bacteroidales bacterium]
MTGSLCRQQTCHLPPRPVSKIRPPAHRAGRREEGLNPGELLKIGSRITDGVGRIIEQSRRTIAVYLNGEVSLTYWRIGKYIAGELDSIGNEKYGSKIVATVSRLLTGRFGKGYTRDAIFRMLKVARAYPDEEIVGTLSRQLTWHHFIELAEVKGSTKRLFYQQMTIVNGWSVRQLREQQDAMAYERTLIAASTVCLPSTSNWASSSPNTRARWNFTSST